MNEGTFELINHTNKQKAKCKYQEKSQAKKDLASVTVRMLWQVFHCKQKHNVYKHQ